MYEGDVLREVWQVKKMLAARSHYDVRELGKAMQEKERLEGRKVVYLSPAPLVSSDGDD